MTQYIKIDRDELKELVLRARVNRENRDQEEINRKVQLICDRENHKNNLLKRIGLFKIAEWLDLVTPQVWTVENIAWSLKWLPLSEQFEYELAKSSQLVHRLNFLRIYAALLLSSDIAIISEYDLKEIKYWAGELDE